MRPLLLTVVLAAACAHASPLSSQQARPGQSRQAQERSGERRHHASLGGDAAPKMRHTADGGAAAVEDKAFWNELCQEELTQQLNKAPIVKKAKNIILFLGDGTGIATFTAARLLKGQRSGNFELEQMAWEKFPYSSIIKTYNTNMQTTDSAASATAYLTGVKANQETIGVDANVRLRDCAAENIQDYHTHSVLKDFQDTGRSGGVVTTTRVTHASPAGNYAHTACRDWESDYEMVELGDDPTQCMDIATQLVKGDTGSKIKVILGGGRRGFIPEEENDPEDTDKHGDRLDGVNLIDEWLQDRENAQFVWNRTALLRVDEENTDSLLGLFTRSHMEYKIEIHEDDHDPTLQEMTEAAIKILSKNEEGYFLFVEGGMIDKGHHENKANLAINEATEFEKAVESAARMTSDQDTLILVTADHSQPITINGYSARGTDILGLGDVSDIDNMPFTTLLYTNGPGYRDQTNDLRPNPQDDDIADSDYRFESAVPMDSSNHNGEDVVLYARGPHAHLFTGVHENAYIPHAMRYAACVGEGLSFCDGQ